MGITPDMTQSQRQEKYVQWYAAESAKIAARHQHPVEFYGQTVDDSNQPVAGVNVSLSLSEPPNPGPHGTLETNLQSDAQGYFVFGDAIGKSLQIRLSKNGYYVSRSNRIDFDYMDYRPNPNQPEVFHLRKKGVGADLITSQDGVFQDLEFSTPRDGTPVRVDYFNRKVGNEGQMQIRTVALIHLHMDAMTCAWGKEIPCLHQGAGRLQICGMCLVSHATVQRS